MKNTSEKQPYGDHRAGFTRVFQLAEKLKSKTEANY